MLVFGSMTRLVNTPFNSLWKAHQIVPVVFSENAKRWSQTTQATTKAAQHSIRSENLQHPTSTIGQDWSIYTISDSVGFS